jgi:hypothetical protein
MFFVGHIGWIEDWFDRRVLLGVDDPTAQQSCLMGASQINNRRPKGLRTICDKSPRILRQLTVFYQTAIC